MKTFTKFVSLLVTILFTYGMITTAQASHFANPNGDNGQPLIEIYVYGVTLPAGTPEVGDEIAIYDGNTIVGLLTLTEVPSTETWIDCRLVGYSKNASGGDLFSPNNPFIFKYWDASATTEYSSWGWGTNGGIDFHDDWYAPTSEDPQATTTGAYFPAEGAYSYCYVDLTFTADAIPTLAQVDVTVWLADGITQVTDATVMAGGTTATSVDNVYTLDLYAGNNGDDEDYLYTVTITHANFKTETFDITVNEQDQGTPYTATVYLGGKGNLEGTVQAFSLTDGWELAEGALVSATIDGEYYFDYTDVAGYYKIDTIPDGSWDFTYSYPNHQPEVVAQTIAEDQTTTTAAVVQLDLYQGTLEGKIYDATSSALLTSAVTVTLLDSDGNALVPPQSVTTATGSYTISYYGGIYDIEVSCGGYNTFVVDDHTFYPDFTETMNFNLLPTGTPPNFTPITGNPNSMWSIHIEMAKFGVNSLLPWDELVIFDTDQAGLVDEPGLRVGTIQLSDPAVWQNAGSNVLKAWGQFSNGTTGFVQGNDIEIWAYDISHDAVYATPVDWWFNAGVGTYSGTTFPNPLANHTSYLNIYWETVPGQLIGTVTDGANPIEGVTVDALNVYTHEVVQSAQTDVLGAYVIADLPESSYDIRFTKVGYDTYTRDTVLILQSQVRNLGVTELDARISVIFNYNFPTQGYYFFGRAAGAANEDMLDLLNNANGFDPFEAHQLNNWVQNDDGSQLIHNGITWDNDPYTWELTEGYQLFTDGYAFDLTGHLVKPEMNPLEFSAAGIYYIPYFPYSDTENDEALTAFASILDSLDWVMDSYGNRLHHDNGAWVDNIGEMSAMEGYKIKLNHSVTLTYPDGPTKAATQKTVRMEPEHFIFEGGNAADWTYTLYIDTDDFEIGDEIAAFSNGVMVGSMVIDSEDPWQNDLNTFNEALSGGYEINSPIELRAWDVSENIDYSVGFEMIDVNNASYLGVNYPPGLDHFSYVKVTRGLVGINNQIDNNIRVYPNPVNDVLTIESDQVIQQVRLYNVYGALLSNTTINAKLYQTNVSSFTPGTYLIQLNTDSGIITKRVIIQ